MGSESPDQTSRSHKVLRVEREETFGARLRGWILRGEARFVDVADLLGVSRNDLSDALDGTKHFRASWIELLPPSVELLYLAERAAFHQMQLAPVASRAASIAEAVMQIGKVLAQCTESEADGYLSPDECQQDLAALRTLIRRLEEVAAHRERGLAQRGIRVVAGAKR